MNEEELKQQAIDAKCFNWLIEHGYNYHNAFPGTASQSMGRGPYIQIEMPSHNRFNAFLPSKELTIEIIEIAIQEKRLKEITESITCKKCNANRLKSECVYPHACGFIGVAYTKEQVIDMNLESPQDAPSRQ